MNEVFRGALYKVNVMTKKIGIIGGIGPASTVDYYNEIITGYRKNIDSDDYPKIIINSINMNEMLSLVANKKWDDLAQLLVNAVNDLKNGGADFAAIACNTAHIVFDRVQQKADLPIISIVKSTCEEAKEKHCKRVLILGTTFIMSNPLYIDALNDYMITAIPPSNAEIEKIHNIIFPNLENGIVIPKDKEKMLEIVDDLIERNNIDSVLLGCTELPLMIKKEDLPCPILNTTEIHIKEIIKYALK